uniref:Leucine-rich repeat-containing N-terminal plant-type domain-containing protein n=1 Tax=Triticum urartu TaxID=4572 RepID=A0A8R7PPJ1_TRIUA
MSSTRRPQLHFTLLLLTYYCSTHIAANGDNGTTVQCLPDEAASLLQLKLSFYNPNLSSWQHGTDCCHWEGVGCSRASGQVISLDLSDRNLQSINGLSPSLFNLTSLTNLSLSGNNFGLTSLPRFGFEQLIELLSLNLSHTNLAGQIPIGISHLKKLRTLDSSHNFELYFNEPSFQMVIGNLSNLRELKLNGVDISRDQNNWSNSLANSVPQLQFLSLDSCGLSGHIHSSFSRLQYLERIILTENSISGEVPQFLTDFSSLSTLDLRYNDFEGQFPTKIFHLEK